ncbi:MAG: GTPase HflX [Clostridia bacterium]|nr:GTPase HflX [Clostridia bacterium]
MLKFEDDNRVLEKEEYRAILVGAQRNEDISYSMEELSGLAHAVNIDVLGHMVQNVVKINAKTYIGKGKLEELVEMCKNMEANLVVFNDELSGIQLRNIEDATGVRTIDRTILILDIFAARAISKEGKLQVEMAQLQYRIPRLLGFGKELSRLGGGIGTRGPGEKKLETDRRHIRKRMDDIKKEMEDIKGTRSTQRSKRVRSDLPVVALVGYTNSGKSSIMNRLLAMESREEKQVLEKDMLFATLDTAQRLITLEDKGSFVLVDTVGFVSKLPHALIKAFKSSLEEVVYADLLLHIVDASFFDADFHIEVTNKVLKELGVGEKPTIIVFNKIDKAPDFLPLAYGKNSLAISTKTGEGYEDLIERIKESIFTDMGRVELLIPYNRGDLVSYICTKAQPYAMEHREEGTWIIVTLNEADRKRLELYTLN